MKKRLPVFAALLLSCALPLAGCSSQERDPLPEGMDTSVLLEAGEDVVGLLSAGEYQAVYEQLREDIRDDLTADDIAAVMDPVLEEAGAFQSVEESSAYGDSEAEPLGVADLLCAFSEEDVRFRVVFDPEMSLTGFSVGVERSGWSFSNLVDNVTGLFGG